MRVALQGARVAAGGVRGRVGVRPPAGQDGPGRLDCGSGEGDVSHDPQGLSLGNLVNVLWFMEIRKRDRFGGKGGFNFAQPWNFPVEIVG